MAREYARIDRILNLIKTYWNIYPDLRLTQIIGNMFPGDPYHEEDDMLEQKLKEALDPKSTFMEKVDLEKKNIKENKPR